MHNGSRAMAHNTDRFAFGSDFEDVRGEAARLNVQPSTLQMYRDWYGESSVLTCCVKGQLKTMPAYEFEIRRQVHGDKLRKVVQLEMALDFGQRAYI